jgi:putative ABC transport system permease protein
MRTLIKDVHYACRLMRKRPGFTAAAIITLLLAIGTNTTIFSIVNGLLLRPLPYPHQDRLVQLSETFPEMESVDLSYPDFLYWKRNSQVFEDMGAFDDTMLLLGGETAELIEGAVITDGLLPTLEVKPAVGRAFLAEEDRPGAAPVAIISYGLWQRRFGSNESLVGNQIILNGESTTVVGIMPPGFGFPEFADVWIPLALDPMEADSNDYSYDAVARLIPGKSITEARAEAEWVASRLARDNPETKRNLGAIVYPLRSADIKEETALAALVLLVAVGFVLLIACVNVANLLLSRALEREKEFAIRLALGAGRGQLIRQILTESLLLASLGAAGGLLVTSWAKDLLSASLPSRLPFWIRFDVDGRVLAFVLAITTLATLLSGLAPAVRSSKTPLSLSFNQGLLLSLGSKRRYVYRFMVVSQIALASTLLVAAGLMFKSFLLLQAVDPGVGTRNILSVRVALPPFKYKEETQAVAFYDRLLERTRALPQVRYAALTSKLPLSGFDNEVTLFPEGFAIEEEHLPVAILNVVSPGFFRSFSVPVLRGRDFQIQGDSTGTLPEAVISESMARRFWPDQDPIGKRIRISEPGSRSGSISSEQPWLTVVGVVGDAQYSTLDSRMTMSIYLSHHRLIARSMALVINTENDPLDVASSARSVIRTLDVDVPVFAVQTMEEVVSRSLWQQRFNSWLLGAFATLALALAAIGIYGVVAFSVRRRYHELGVRLVLGAERREILEMILKQGAYVVALGTSFGLLGALLATKALGSLLYGVPSRDLSIYVLALTTAASTALLASYFPARRASRVDPSTMLRYQ